MYVYGMDMRNRAVFFKLKLSCFLFKIRPQPNILSIYEKGEIVESISSGVFDMDV